MEIIICSKCKGKGENYADAESNSENATIKCNNCNGTGRVIKRTYSLEIPLNFDKNKINEVDEKIFQLIRNLK